MTRAHRRMPTDLDLDRRITPAAARLWRTLDDVCREWTSCALTLSQLAMTLHCSTSAVQKWRRQLVDAGWLLVEPARGRGDVTVWTPLRRARPVLHSGVEPVDNSARRVDGRVDRNPPSDQGKGGRESTLDRGATRARVEEQKREGVIVLPLTDDRGPAAPCSLCAGTRLVDSLLRDGAVTRCPACHPGYSPAF